MAIYCYFFNSFNACQTSLLKLVLRILKFYLTYLNFANKINGSAKKFICQEICFYYEVGKSYFCI